MYEQYDAMEAAVLEQVAAAQQQYQQAVAAEEEAARIAAEEEARRQQEEQSGGAAEETPSDPQESNESTGGEGNGETSGSEGNNETAGGSEGSSNGGNQGTTGPGAGTGQFIRPVSGGYISSPYGWRLHPTLGYEKFHYGVDYDVPEGTPIYAVASGTVTIATNDESAGNYVSVAHSDGFASAYMHMSYYVVSVGDYVTQGQLLGYVGSTGRSTGPHLHLAMYYNGSFVNPVDYVGAA